MATALTGIPRKGIDSTGGVDYFLFADYTEIAVTVTDLVATITLADGSPIAKGTNPFKKYYPEAESGNLTSPITVTGAVGQKSAEETATMVFSRLSMENRLELKKITDMRSLIIEVDFNGETQVSGVQSGALCSVTPDTGTGGADLNGFTVTSRAPGADILPSVDKSVLDIISIPD